MELIFASHNINKASEIQSSMPAGMEIKTLDAISFKDEIPETGNSLEENALIKAREVYSFSGHNCFADDSGLEVVALGGAPGVYSARYAGETGNAAKNMDKLLAAMDGLVNREAQFRTIFALILDGKEYIFEGLVKGEITTERRGQDGFGYDPIFQPKGLLVTFAEMSKSDKNKISHRARALSKMVAFLRETNHI